MNLDDGFSDGTTEFIAKKESQDLDERKRIRESYNDLISSNLKEKEKDDISIENIEKNLERGQELFKDVYRTREAVYDARYMSSCGELIKMKANSLRVGMEFNPSSFLRKLAVDVIGKDTNADVLPLDEEHWINLGKRGSSMFKTVPTLTFCHGTFPDTTADVAQPQRRARARNVETTTKEPASLEPNTMQVNNDKTYEEIKRIKKILGRLYSRRGNKPICFFEFTMDPESFPRTMQNIFHLAFLVKEQEVMLLKDPNGLPVIEPVIRGKGNKSSQGGNPVTCSQSLLTMSMEKWKKIIEDFKIREPIIPPVNSND